MENDFFEAWYFIAEHPKFMEEGESQTFPYGLEIMVMKVDPATSHVSIDKSKNTKIEVWLEHGPYEYIKELGREEPTHDLDLDCGADTFEEAIIKLANLIRKKYGDY